MRMFSLIFLKIYGRTAASVDESPLHIAMQIYVTSDMNV